MSAHTAITASALRGRALGVLVGSAGFGTLWAAMGLAAWRGILTVPGAIVTAAVLVALLAAVIQLMRMARRHGLPDPHAPKRRRYVGRFLLILVGEIVAMNILGQWLYPQHAAYLIPVVATIVGLHFFPLASLFRAPQVRVTATAMTLAGIAGIAALAAGVNAAACHALVDAACALTLWISGFFTWRAVRRSLPQATASA